MLVYSYHAFFFDGTNIWKIDRPAFSQSLEGVTQIILLSLMIIHVRGMSFVPTGTSPLRMNTKLMLKVVMLQMKNPGPVTTLIDLFLLVPEAVR